MIDSIFEGWQAFAIQGTALGGLLWFMRSQSKRQDRVQGFFEKTLNGSLIEVRDALHESTVAERETATALRDLTDSLDNGKHR